MGAKAELSLWLHKIRKPWKNNFVCKAFRILIKAIVYSLAKTLLYQQGQFHYHTHQHNKASRDILKGLFSYALKWFQYLVFKNMIKNV